MLNINSICTWCVAWSKFLLVSAVLQRSLTLKEPALFSKSSCDSKLRLWPKSGWPLHGILPNWLLPIKPGLAIWFLAFPDMGPSSLLRTHLPERSHSPWLPPASSISTRTQSEHPGAEEGRKNREKSWGFPSFSWTLAGVGSTWRTAGFMQS